MRILLLCALMAGACASEWNYDSSSDHGPDDWPDECVLDTSTSQSPININTGNVQTESSYSDFNFNNYDHVDVELTNNGHSVQATLKSYENALLTGGGLVGTYKLAQFHLHWGSNNNQGSEHKVDGVQYPMEVHFVHYKTTYSSLADAADKTDGLAVMAWFFKIDDDNDDWDDIFDELPLTEGSTVSINDLDLEDLMGDDDEYYRYQGSLTTPPCYESVTWTVFKKKIEIDSSQMAVVRSVENSHGHKIYNNFRPIQNLNSRTVLEIDD